MSDIDRGQVLEWLEAAQQIAGLLEDVDGMDERAFTVRAEALVEAVDGARATIDRIVAETAR